LTGWGDTIAALATPSGIGAIGVIRLSGSRSWEIVDGLFPSRDLLQQASHTLHVGLLKDGDSMLDEVVVSLFRGPRSYTGEDVVEVSCHGSPFVQEQVLKAFLRRGARMAKPGEFTQRAFLQGKLDLTQAEAVADLIASNTVASARTALNSIRGGFSRVLKELRVQLLSFSALIELELDFSQEDVEFADRTQFYRLIDEATQTTQSLLQSFRLGNVIRNGVQVAIVGKPNAGKSTLLNTLLNENRAIVSEIAGTTRDTIEETLNIDGILFRLIDTAGIRQHTQDLIERIGVERSLEKMEQADIIVYLFDVNDAVEEVRERWTELVKRNKPFLLVGNKADTLGDARSRERFELLPPSDASRDKEELPTAQSAAGIASRTVFISARDQQHISTLKDALVAHVIQGTVKTEDTMVTNVRHYQALQQVFQSLVEIRQGLDSRLTGDLLALDIRRCLHYLGEITGEITNEDQLDYIFSKFCIGK
jgi:tRNA modification GTPase